MSPPTRHWHASLMLCASAALVGCGGGGSSAAPANRPPAITTTSFNAVEDTDFGGTLIASDPDGDAITLAVVTQPLHGTLVSFTAAGAFVYRPAANFFGSDTLQVRATDPVGLSATTTITIAVSNVNDAPVAVDDIVSVQSGATVTVNVLANDTDLDNDTLNVAVSTLPTSGTVTVLGDGRVQLAFSQAFRGFTRFGYSITDAGGVVRSAAAIAFVGTAPVALTWLGDDLTSGVREMMVHNGLAVRRANTPLQATQQISEVVFRVDGSKPTVGYTVRTSSNSLTDAGFVAALEGAPAEQGLGSPRVTSIASDGQWALTEGNGQLGLVRTDTPGATAIGPTANCHGTFAGAADDLVLYCSQPGPIFAGGAFYRASLTAPTAYTQLSPLLTQSGADSTRYMSPDGSRLIYIDYRSDSNGIFGGLYMIDLATPLVETRISPRLPTTELGVWPLQFSNDGSSTLFALGTNPPFTCNLWSVPLSATGSPVQITPVSLPTSSCPRIGTYSPDGSKVAFVTPDANGAGGVYEVALANTSVVTQLIAPTAQVFIGALKYDESGQNLFFFRSTSNGNGGLTTELLEWHRGTPGTLVALSPGGLQLNDLAISDDGALIAFSATDSSSPIVSRLYLANRSTPGQATLLSAAGATLGLHGLTGFRMFRTH
jgi:hypothetical protein